jgi:hypothetical protein
MPGSSGGRRWRFQQGTTPDQVGVENLIGS